LRYYQTELQKNISQIKHPVIKQALKNFNKKKNGLEISHFADVPALSGLGASSAFTVSMINAIYAYNNKKITKNEIAKKAIFLEQKILKENVGSQDQIATAFGGFNFISFKKNKFSFNKINIDSSILNEFQNRLVIIYTNSSRKAWYFWDEYDAEKTRAKIKLSPILQISKTTTKTSFPHFLIQSLEQENLGYIFLEHQNLKKNYFIASHKTCLFENGDFIDLGEPLTEGNIDIHSLLKILTYHHIFRDGVQEGNIRSLNKFQLIF
jgi:mevalonate kinase